MTITLPENATIPTTHTVIERGGERYNVIAETQTDYIVAFAMNYHDSPPKVSVFFWDKAYCKVV